MHWVKLFLASYLLIGWMTANAVDAIQITLDTAWLTEDTGIRGSGIQLSLTLGEDSLLLLGEATSLRLPAPYGEMKNVRLRCANFTLAQADFSCHRGTLQFVHAEFGQQKLQFSLVGNSEKSHYQISIDDMALADGSLRLTAEVKDKQWSAKISSQQLAASVILALAGTEHNTVLLPLADWLAVATADVDITLSGQERIEQLTIDSKWVDLGSAAGLAALTGEWQATTGSWTADFTSQQLATPDLVTLAQAYSENAILPVIKTWLSAGQTDISLQLAGKNSQLNTAKLVSDIANLSGSDEAGEWVAESVSAKVTGEWQGETGEWRFTTQANSGQVYGEPIFLDFSENALSLTGQGRLNMAQQRIEVTQADIRQVGVAQANITATANLADWMQSDIFIDVADIKLSSLYKTWFQPFLLSNAAGKMLVSGEAGLKLHKTGDTYQVNLALDAVSVADEENRFQLQDLSGELGWTSLSTPVQSTLSWQGGQLYAIPFGDARFQMESVGSRLRLMQPAILPVLDGALTISEFALERPLDDSTQWSFAAALSPISMPLLSEKLGWPSLSGKLSGNIPQVAYQYKNITMAGDLSVNLFGGQAVINDLELAEPFGALPQLSANVDMTGIDLTLLTETFDFGNITGRLDGYIHDLRLSNWQTVAFDAAFATPQGDKHRRRISQQAVEQLTEVGGGPSAALSKSFLRFFEDFSYQKMGLSCKLRNNVCEMAGVGDAASGYYIVKGGGLPPRINIVGYTKRVDWSDLLARLKAVSESDGPIVK